MSANNENRTLVTDRQILQLRFERLSEQVHNEFQAFEDHILPTLKRIEIVLADIVARVTSLETRAHHAETRIYAIEKQLPKKRKAKR